MIYPGIKLPAPYPCMPPRLLLAVSCPSSPARLRYVQSIAGFRRKKRANEVPGRFVGWSSSRPHCRFKGCCSPLSRKKWTALSKSNTWLIVLALADVASKGRRGFLAPWTVSLAYVIWRRLDVGRIPASKAVAERVQHNVKSSTAIANVVFLPASARVL